MKNYLFLLSGMAIKDYDRSLSPYSFCREIVIYYYEKQLLRFKEEKDYPDINLYIGHDFTNSNPEIVSRYISFANEIWKNKVEVSLVNLYDIDDSPDVKLCKDLFTGKKYSEREPIHFVDVPLLKIHSAVNSLDLSIFLHTTWYNKTFANSKTEMYYLAKKYTDLIPDTFFSIYNLRYNIYNIPNGPETYLEYLQENNIELYNKINDN
jgi:hypothetical protein